MFPFSFDYISPVILHIFSEDFHIRFSEHRKAKYQILLLQGKLVEHLNQIDAEARDREEQLVKQMMEKEGITEELKRQDNMEWTRRMNTLCHDAEEMILTEMIYTKG